MTLEMRNMLKKTLMSLFFVFGISSCTINHTYVEDDPYYYGGVQRTRPYVIYDSYPRYYYTSPPPTYRHYNVYRSYTYNYRNHDDCKRQSPSRDRPRKTRPQSHVRHR